jgi:type IV pilus assembly protein PilM
MGLLGGANSTVGLELDAQEARVVEIKGGPRAPALIRWGRIPLPDGAVEEGMVHRPQEVGQALAELWRTRGIGSREVIVGVSNQAVLVRFATFPRVPREKLGNVIRFQAQEHLPMALSSVVLDYAVIGEANGEGGAHGLEVLLVAARREMLDGFLAALAAARLKPRDVDVASLALLRILPGKERAGTVALVNVANGLSNILVAAGGVPRLARLMPVSLREAAGTLGTTLREVVPSGGAGQERPPESLRPWCDGLAGEIRSSVGYYETQRGAAVELVLLSGRGARVAGLPAHLQESLGIPVRTVQPLDGIKVTAPADAGIRREALDYAVSIGLARRGMEA